MTELHYITHRANLASIVRLGILSHRRVTSLPHRSIADEEVQDRRRNKRVPNGLLIHEYANAYFDARNPMMYKRLDQRRELAVISIMPGILDLPGTVISDGNAASDGTLFSASPEGLTMLDEQRVYAEWWTDGDGMEKWERKRQRCAEVLVPDRIAPEYIRGCYVFNSEALPACRAAGLKAAVNKRVFFD
ncbi:DUF4433 domain-containing protein [Spongiactinospora rosea]|uniref:DUF4433 domain-containing protein n=1 Tax=Spongiactinospora rosea TaxID=2248750 RepID=UPI001313FD38|nr:DUF4433 domain-containing protein [Spongiactinospora rosea]